MYDRKSKNKTAYSVLFLILPVMFMCSCKSTELYNNGAGNTEYRELQSDIRDGETELAVTGTKIEQTSEQLATGISELEQAITSSTANEQEIGNLLQQIRTREIPDNIAVELRKKYPDLFRE